MFFFLITKIHYWCNSKEKHLQGSKNGDTSETVLPAQFNHLSVVRLKVVLPAHSDAISGHS